jgi:hypothetical protein
MLLPVLMLLLPTATAIIAPSLVAAARWRRILGAIAILAVTAQSGLWAFQWLILTQPQPPLPYILSHQSREAYLQSALNYYRPYQYLANLQRESATPIHVLHHGEHRIYYARHTAFWSDWFDTTAILRIIRQDQCRTVADLRQALQRRAITHIFVNDAELAPQLERYFRRRFTQGEWVLTESFLATLKPLQDQPGQFRILEVPVP